MCCTCKTVSAKLYPGEIFFCLESGGMKKIRNNGFWQWILAPERWEIISRKFQHSEINSRKFDKLSSRMISGSSKSAKNSQTPWPSWKIRIRSLFRWFIDFPSLPNIAEKQAFLKKMKTVSLPIASIPYSLFLWVIRSEHICCLSLVTFALFNRKLIDRRFSACDFHIIIASYIIEFHADIQYIHLLHDPVESLKFFGAARQCLSNNQTNAFIYHAVYLLTVYCVATSVHTTFAACTIRVQLSPQTKVKTGTREIWHARCLASKLLCFGLIVPPPPYRRSLSREYTS